MQFSSSLPSLVGGVSQKAPEARSAVRHAEQVNMVSDPVRGLVRRPGTLYKDDTLLSTLTTASQDTAAFRSFDFRTVGGEYAMVGRVAATVAPTPAEFFAVDKDTGAVLPMNRTVTDPVLDSVLSSGVGATTALGRFLVFSPNGGQAAYARTERWTPELNQSRHVVWIRGGAYSRTFRAALIRGNQKFWIEYTTRQASYPEALDTSDILPSDPEYTKKVNDRTNAYNSLALKWAGEALADSTPESVVQRLATELRLSGFLAPGATVEVVGTHLCITDSTVEEVEVDDSGDGNLMRSTGNSVGAPELLTPIAYPGKVIKVRPTNEASGISFYVEAVSKDKSLNRYTEVLWQEAPGVRLDVTQAFVFATVHNGVFYASSDLAWLGVQIGETVPGYVSNSTGDGDTVPAPAFFDNPITALAVFQDRLLVMSGGAITTSRPGDYLNFFRSSLVSVSATDPLEFSVIGGEDDVIRHAAVWDRNLLLTGEKRPYVLDGRRPLAPGSVSATPISTSPDIANVPPVPMGNFLFYARAGDGSCSVHQFRPGRSLDTPLTEELSYELDTYLTGDPVELQVNATPGFLFLRTTSTGKLFVYQFTDTEDGRRVTDAWHTWTFPGGSLLAVIPHKGKLLLVGRRQAATGTYAVVDQMPLDAGAWALPHLDSMIPGNQALVKLHPVQAYYADDVTLEGRSAAYFVPTLNFSASNTAPGVGVSTTFTATASSPIESYLWTFGDGSPPSTAASPTKTYAAMGMYTVTLTARLASGDVLTVTRTNYIQVPDPILFTVNLDAVLGGSSHLAPGAVTITGGFTAGDTLILEMIDGVYDGFSGWASDTSTNPTPPPVLNHTWAGFVNIRNNTLGTFPTDWNAGLTGGGQTWYQTNAAVTAAIVGETYTLTGGASYTFWINDSNPGDNRGGLSFTVKKLP